ncbi:MAG: TetR/AcrR family transcriptional regulator [Niameybacter sp.]
MKREEQNEKSRNRILQAALKEYGSKNFSETSINTICKENGISKGLIYHYFKNVDQLFLACVDECFTQMYEYLEEKVHIVPNDKTATLDCFFKERCAFFSSKPELAHVFSIALFQVPPHLKNEVRQRKAKLDKFNRNLIGKLLNLIELREGVTIEEAVEYIMSFSEFYNNSFNELELVGYTEKERLDLHEARLLKAIDLLIYGIGK